MINSSGLEMSPEIKLEGKEPIKCNLCDRTFESRSKLITHEVVHTGLKPFKCNECDKQYSQRNVLPPNFLPIMFMPLRHFAYLFLY